jgi:hypothetical protein
MARWDGIDRRIRRPRFQQLLARNPALPATEEGGVTELIVLVPALIAWWVAARQSLEAAFLGVYLPVILMLPNYFTWQIDHFPDPCFHACIMPIGLALCWKAFIRREWQISLLDFAVVAYLSWQIVCEMYNVGLTTMPDLLWDLANLAVFPYMAAKTLIEQKGLRAAFARRWVMCILIVCAISVYEFRLGISLIREALLPLFPKENGTWVTQLRWGFGRIAGPYGHAISMAVVVGIAILLHRWLTREGLWEKNFKLTGALPLSKPQIISFGLVAGILMTISRGPWIGAVCGAVLASVGLRDDRRRALTRALLILAVSGVVLYVGGKAYLSGANAFEGVEEQASAAYRAILIDQYEDIVMISPIFGWGRANWPVVQGMLSIDNNYLFVALGTGLVGLGLLVVMFLSELWRIFASGYFKDDLTPGERMFRFTLVGILVSIAISTGTTYISAHLYPIFFMLLGWSEACVITRKAAAEEPVSISEMAAVPSYRLMRVVA